LFKDLKAASAMRGKIDGFHSGLSAEARQTRLDGWAAAVKSVIEAAH
jgi:glycerol kinase